MTSTPTYFRRSSECIHRGFKPEQPLDATGKSGNPAGVTLYIASILGVHPSKFWFTALRTDVSNKKDPKNWAIMWKK